MYKLAGMCAALQDRRLDMWCPKEMSRLVKSAQHFQLAGQSAPRQD